MKFGIDAEYLHHMSWLTFERSRSKFKVKITVLKMFDSLWFKITLSNWQFHRSNYFGMTYAFGQDSRWQPDGGLHSGSFL